MHLVPRKVYARIVFQIPVQTDTDIGPRFAPDDNAGSLLVEFEVVALCGAVLLDFELFRCPRVDALQ